MGKRKRKMQGHDDPSKRQKVEDSAATHPTAPLLRNYYPSVSTLRSYLASQLITPKKRRKRLLQYGRGDGAGSACDAALVRLLDCTLVGSFNRSSADGDLAAYDQDVTVFTQQVSEATKSIGPTQGAFKQSETVDFVIWALFFRRPRGSRRPSHVLCHGYQRTTTAVNAVQLNLVPGVPGVLSNCENQHVRTLKQHPWTALPSLIGSTADRTISALLIECGVFVPAGDTSNLVQLSGVPMSELQDRRPSIGEAAKDSKAKRVEDRQENSARYRGLSGIRFVRHRMLYAKPSHTSTGQPRPGLPFMHVLSRLRNTPDACETVRIMNKDHERRRKGNLAGSVTVEFSRLPGQSFYRKMLTALKLQMHAMLLSTSYNATRTVLRNLHHAFFEVALKCHHYLQSLRSRREPNDALLISKSTQGHAMYGTLANP
ncbi:hypothetical protein BAUCODRAFT_80286 [Baudoinia panamericana UAMH 10762]|uniref:Telomerase reverse transcriptase n=1 Tax=Baudoinia panamericana (strain UAMH 10762) TaxID=717646 RepID=M2MXG2_BAUPA|nr:uncharacterized protein BAUCODRAFT_80286 [Baudoinia panamericana UAMH 10762]EMC91354.1 hypothetical protein BAUCODRAFT_80286 [Baudoinia panamericana UAMH 10762]